MRIQKIPNFIVIDDDPVNNIVCREIISHTYPHANIKTFVDPHKGLEYLESEYEKYSDSRTILFLDINMPAISGWDFLGYFENLNQQTKEQFKIYILSSSIDPLDKIRSTSNKNVYDYIPKPLTKKAVEEVVNKLWEEESAALSREIHDELGQQLMRIKMDVIWLSSKIKEPDEHIKQKVSDAISLVDDTFETIRRINTGLRPRIIDDLGLFAAMEWQANEFTKHTGISCNLKTDMPESEFSKLLSGNVFRIFQESLTNIGKHAGATEVGASVRYSNGNMIMSIEDNGKGFDPEMKKERSFGLSGMKERAAVINATIKIRSKLGEGSQIELTVPVII